MPRKEASRAFSSLRTETSARNESFHPGVSDGALASTPPVERWEDWLERVANAWPRAVARRTTVVPTTCQSCPAGCGLLAFVDRDGHEPYRFEGNPLHPGSQGRLCPGGLATQSQRRAPDRVLQPMRRSGPRGSGKWTPITWDEALDDVAGRIRDTITSERLDELLVHLGAAEPDPFLARTLGAWGMDVLHLDSTAASPQAAAGYQLWMGSGATCPDLHEAELILMVGAPADADPVQGDARGLAEARKRGARVVLLDPVLSRTAGLTDTWLRPLPGTEGAILLAIASHIIGRRSFNRDFMRRWWNWAEYMEARYPGVTISFPRFELALQKLYGDFSFEYAAQESGVPAEAIQELAEAVERAGPRLATVASGMAVEGGLGGWQVARSLFLLNALAGAIDVPGAVAPDAWCRFVPQPFAPPAPHDQWNRLPWPDDWPLASGPASPLLPHLLRDGRGALRVYVSDRFNPVGTSPDGFAWMSALSDETRVAFHVAITPVWNETARLADVVLPVGLSGEVHGLVSRPHPRTPWLAMKQPVTRVSRQRADVAVTDTRKCNPGQVWEDDELWTALTWRIDQTGAWGLRDAHTSHTHTGEPMGPDEYYAHLLDHNVPGLAEQAALQGLSALELMRRRGVHVLPPRPPGRYDEPLAPAELESLRENRIGRVFVLPREDSRRNQAPVATPTGDVRGRQPVGVRVDGELLRGFETPGGRLEFYSSTLADWGWPEMALPTYVKSHVHREVLRPDEHVLIPLIEHPWDAVATSTPWLSELAHANPLWIHPTDASALGLDTGMAVTVETELGHFVTRAWVTEGVLPRTVACNLRRGRWRLTSEPGAPDVAEMALNLDGEYRQLSRAERPRTESDPRWWSESAVPALMAIGVHPDPVTGAHCWMSAVRVRAARVDELPGDVTVDLARSQRVFEQWRSRARPAATVSPDGNRRPTWLIRALRPVTEAYRLPEAPRT